MIVNKAAIRGEAEPLSGDDRAGLGLRHGGQRQVRVLSMPVLMRPDDVARAALFLSNDDATFVTGHDSMVDGGCMAF